MHDDDRKWVGEQLKKLPTPAMRGQTLIKYNEVFQLAHDAEPLPHRKDGKARFAANNRLRQYVEAVIKLTPISQ